MYNLSPADGLGGESSTDDSAVTRPVRAPCGRLNRTACVGLAVITIVVIILALAIGLSGKSTFYDIAKKRNLSKLDTFCQLAKI